MCVCVCVQVGLEGEGVVVGLDEVVEVVVFAVDGEEGGGVEGGEGDFGADSLEAEEEVSIVCLSESHAESNGLWINAGLGS